MNYLTELKRRNVFKVAIAYLALGWVVVQITDIVVPALNLPETLNSIVVYIGIIGFPFALFFAWAFELTPEGVQWTVDVEERASNTQSTGQNLNYVIISLLSIAVVFLFFNQKISNNDNIKITNSIAVLPFVNMSEDQNNVYFSDGLSEEILNVLTKFSDLKVTGRTSSFVYKENNRDLRVIGEALGVDHLLEGSVRKQNNRVRITAQLIRAEDGFHIWSETYDRDLSDIFIVQEEIANSIANNLALKMELMDLPSLISTRTDNMQAYELYLESRMLLSRRGSDNVVRALSLLDQALELDPNYAAGWGMLAQAHTIAYYYVDIETTFVGMYLGEEAARRALQLDPKSSLAHSALGGILKDKNHWAEAEEQYLLALKYDPGNIEAIEQFGQLYQRTGHFSKAIPYLMKASTLDPFSPVYKMVEGMSRDSYGEREHGIKLINEALETSNNSVKYLPSVRFQHGIDLDDDNQIRRYITLLMEHNEIENPQFFNDQLLEVLGDETSIIEYLQAILQHLENNPEDLNKDMFSASLTYAALAAKYNKYDMALTFLEIEAGNIIEYKNHDVLTSYWMSVLNPIQNDPRLKQLRINYGLVDYWKTNGWPDFCRPIGDDDFECGWQGNWP